jgi:magnesium chelatase family protein
MNPAQVRDFAQAFLEPTAAELLKRAVDRLNLSARAYHRVLKVARTIADLAGSDAISAQHMAESIQYRARLD